MIARPKTQAERVAIWQKKQRTTTTPEEFCSLIRFLPDPAALLGVDRVTLSRWCKGESRIPAAAAKLARLLYGELPDEFGEWKGWKFTPGGHAYPPGWGEPIWREDIINCWTWRKNAFLAAGLARENDQLRRELVFLRNELKAHQRLGFAHALADAVHEKAPDPGA